jgi:hypothetical protein
MHAVLQCSISMEIMFAIPRLQESKHVSSPLIVIYDPSSKIYQQQKS